MLFNDKATFTRTSNFVIENWQSGDMYTILNPNIAAYLSIEVTVTSPGSLVIDGLSSAGVTISESVDFSESGIKLSDNEFSSILTLTPTWSTYNISIKAEDKQGQPIESSTTYGPFLVSMQNVSSDSQRDNVNVTGWERGQWMVVYIQSFRPQVKDLVTSAKGWTGWAQDVIPSPHINYPKGWQFFVIANQQH